MVTTRIPPEAFDCYVGLGPARSYRQVADRYGVSKRAITKLAVREDWAARLQKIERQARERSDAKLTETVEEMRTRHLTLLKAMSSRVVTALREFPLNSGMEAMRAAEMVIKLERLITGEPSERTELTVEEVTKRELDHWFTVEPEGDGGNEGTGGDNEQRTE